MRMKMLYLFANRKRERAPPSKYVQHNTTYPRFMSAPKAGHRPLDKPYQSHSYLTWPCHRFISWRCHHYLELHASFLRPPCRPSALPTPTHHLKLRLSVPNLLHLLFLIWQPNSTFTLSSPHNTRSWRFVCMCYPQSTTRALSMILMRCNSLHRLGTPHVPVIGNALTFGVPYSTLMILVNYLLFQAPH